MANYRGVLVSVIVSLFGVPMVVSGLCHPVMSQFLPMYVYNYSLLLTALVFFVAALPPNICCPDQLRRNEIYYMSCLFMCLCTGSATSQAWRVHAIPNQPNVKVGYFQYDEPYMNTPFGMSTVIWNDFVNYFIYISLIYMIDNGFNYRNIALYWCGGTLTSEFVSIIGSFIGCNSHQLHYSEIRHIAIICATTWVLYKFLLRQPRCINLPLYCTRFKLLDRLLIVLLAFYSLLGVVRGLGGLGGRQKLVTHYVINYEPYIIHPARFGAVWVLYTAVYGIPFQFAAIKALMRPGSRWLIDMSILYASSLMQGTVVFLSYSFYPTADKKFKIPPRCFYGVMSLNLVYVLTAHALMYRCLMEPGYIALGRNVEKQETSYSACSAQNKVK